MEFKIIVSSVASPGETWKELYNEETSDPESWGKEVVNRYNMTLRPGETARIFRGVEILSGTTKTPHRWEKTNSFTIAARGGGTYDAMKCKTCGVTARRTGLGSIPKRDHRYKAAVYAFCETAQAQIAKRKK